MEIHALPDESKIKVEEDVPNWYKDTDEFKQKAVGEPKQKMVEEPKQKAVKEPKQKVVEGPKQNEADLKLAEMMAEESSDDESVMSIDGIIQKILTKHGKRHQGSFQV